MMALRTFVVGLGRSGTGLHLPVIRKLRHELRTTGILSPEPIAVFDPNVREPESATARGDDVLVVRSMTSAAELLDPDRTVVHLCVPPSVRPGAVRELASAGFTRAVLEKPLACGTADADTLVRIADEQPVDLLVVAHWLAADLTRRLARAIRSGEHGRLRKIVVRQHKARFERSLAARAGDTAFDLELPHALGLVLSLAGHGTLADASCSPLRCDEGSVPWLGGAGLVIRHANGVTSNLTSDLAAPVRQRSVTLRFEFATVTGHYPVSADDAYAQLTVRTRAGRFHEAFRDDALTAFLAGAYRHFAGRGEPPHGSDLRRHREIVRILTAAKRRCGVPDVPAVPAPRAASNTGKDAPDAVAGTG